MIGPTGYKGGQGNKGNNDTGLRHSMHFVHILHVRHKFAHRTKASMRNPEATRFFKKKKKNGTWQQNVSLGLLCRLLHVTECMKLKLSTSHAGQMGDKGNRGDDGLKGTEGSQGMKGPKGNRGGLSIHCFVRGPQGPGCIRAWHWCRVCFSEIYKAIQLVGCTVFRISNSSKRPSFAGEPGDKGIRPTKGIMGTQGYKGDPGLKGKRSQAVLAKLTPRETVSPFFSRTKHKS